MRFYDYAAAPSPRKVRLFIAEKGLSIPTVEVDLRAQAQLEPEFLAKNPGATVPVLEFDDGTCLTESLAHYREAVHPDPNLLGTDAGERALVSMLTDIQTPFATAAPPSYVDIVGYVSVGFAKRVLGDAAPLEGRPALQDWHERIAVRPAIQCSA